jgi:chromatin remodeling complex protein RSC6
MPASKKHVKKATPPKETVVEAPPTPEVVESAAAVVVEAPTESLGDEFAELLSTLNTLKSTVTALSTRVRALQKRTDREMKVALKTKRKRGPNGADGKPRKPSGFVKPTDITPELAKFLGKEKGVQMARTQVTREINSYIREHKLQDPSNGRKINPDAKLRKLLNVKPKEELTYFNLQRYMSPHFVKSTPVTASA